MFEFGDMLVLNGRGMLLGMWIIWFKVVFSFRFYFIGLLNFIIFVIFWDEFFLSFIRMFLGDVIIVVINNFVV